MRHFTSRERAPPVECGSLLPLFAARACPEVHLAFPFWSSLTVLLRLIQLPGLLTAP